MLRDDFMHDRELAGKPKGIKRVLKERGLWPERGLVLECPATHTRRVLEEERDFRNQKGCLQEEVEALDHRVLFYPEPHYELNFIECYWCRAEWEILNQGKRTWPLIFFRFFFLC